MYVAELDRPWTDTPFIFQGFALQTPEQLEILKAYCSVVFVDPDRAEIISRLADTVPPRTRATVDLGRSGKLSWTVLTPVEKEYPAAARCYSEADALVGKCVVAVRSAGLLQPRKLSEAVSAITTSVLSNPDAMLLFSRLQEKGDYTQSHALDCAIYMTAFGRFLEMSPDDIVLLGHLGLLQDIGKARLPTPLLEKRGKLTPIEYSLAQRHVEYSEEILRATPGLPRGLADLATLHHERVDGSGYPRGLRGKDIGLMGCIAAIVDTFDALTASRPYAKPVSPSDALKVLYNSRGKLFDSYLVEQFIRCIGVFPVGSTVELNGGELGIVIAQNPVRRLQPRVMVIQDGAGNAMRQQKVIDLSRGTTAPDGHPYRIRRARPQPTIGVKAADLFLAA
jgi:HD-GYP domain-containing protein (c-di-GMP phosphodiesterase class II)